VNDTKVNNTPLFTFSWTKFISWMFHVDIILIMFFIIFTCIKTSVGLYGLQRKYSVLWLNKK